MRCSGVSLLMRRESFYLPPCTYGANSRRFTRTCLPKFPPGSIPKNVTGGRITRQYPAPALELTQEFYRRVGGLPRAPLGEEKALVTALRRLDAQIRFAPDVFVTTSGRTVGRAPGGSADTLRLRSHNVQAPCDEALELCSVAYKRALWRGRLRRLGYMKTAKWRLTLGLSDATARDAQAASTFGAAWEIIERSSPALRRRLLTPSELPREIARARRLLGRLEEKLSAPQHVEPVFGASIAAGALDTIL